MSGLPKTTAVGLLLFIPALALQLIPQGSWLFTPGGAVDASWSLGVLLPFFSFSTTTGWHLHPTGVVSLALAWVAPMWLGGAQERWAGWRFPRARVAFHVSSVLASAVLISLVFSAAFSTAYWGYAWTRPALPSDLSEVTWERLSPFISDRDGRHWAITSETYWLEDRHEDDTECCRIARIRRYAKGALAALTEAELAEAETQLLERIELERGEPGYEFARELRGLVATGTHPTLGQVTFVTFFTREVSNDHHAIDEAWWTRSPVTLRSHRRVYADIAGIEGLSGPVLLVTIAVALVFFAPLGISAWLVARSLWRWLRGPRPVEGPEGR